MEKKTQAQIAALNATLMAVLAVLSEDPAYQKELVRVLRRLRSRPPSLHPEFAKHFKEMLSEFIDVVH